MTTTPTSDVDNGPRRSSIARNFGVMMGSQVSTFIMTMAGTIIIPRFLGPELIGRLQLATAIWLMGLALIRFGMDFAITKMVARNNHRLGHLVATGIVTRLLISIPVTVVLFTYARIVGYDDQVLVLLVIVGISTLVQSAANVTVAALTGVERMGPVSASAVAGRFLAVGGGIVLLFLGYNVYAVALAALTGTVVTTLILMNALRKVWREIEDAPPVRISRRGIVDLLRESFPYFWVSFFMIAYQQIDTAVISIVVEDDAVLGWYSVFDRLSGTLMFVPTVFMAVVYPTLARLYGDPGEGNREAHALITQRTFRLMLLISVPSGFGVAVISRPLVRLLYGDEFINASQVVAVGAIIISLTYLTTIFAMFLISMDREKSLTIFIALGAILTIPLDIFLVPFFQDQISNGAVGGVAAYAVTETIILAGVLYLMPRGALGPSALSFTIRVVAAGGLMVAAIYPLRNQFLLLPIVVGAITFIAAGALLRLTTKDDRDLVVSMIPNRILSVVSRG